MPEVRLLLPPGGAPVIVDLGPDLADAVARGGGWYERHLMALLPHVLPVDGVALDIGANAGAVTLAMARCAPRGRVVAFEAAPANADRLAANLAATGTRNVDLARVAVYDRTAELRLTFADEASAGASVSGARGAAGTVVPAVALDDWARQADLARLDLVKVDVEGSELRVLRGARGLLERHRPTLLVECSPVSLRQHDGQPVDALLDELDLHGYRLGWIAGRGAVIPLPDRNALHAVLATTGIADLVAVHAGRLPTAGGPPAWAGRLRAHARVRAANPRRRPPRDRFVTTCQVRLQVGTPPEGVESGSPVRIPLVVANDGPGWVSSTFRRRPVYVTHRWVDPRGTTLGDEPRTSLPAALAPGESCAMALDVTAPDAPGAWTLVIRAVQEHFVWLDQLDPAHALRIPIGVHAHGRL